MTITVDEKFETLETTDARSTRRLYIIRGTDDDVEAMAALKTEAPLTYNGLLRKDCRIEVAGPGMWLGEAPYAAPGALKKKPLDVGESSFTFDTTGGGTQHITQAMVHIASYAKAGETAPDYKGAIGVTDDGVEGVDIGLRSWRWSETHVKANADVTDAYKRALWELTYTVNVALFKGHAAGECLFMGASGSRRGDGDWEIAYQFAGSPNRTGLTVGEITGIAKQGWDYLWVLYETVEDDAAKQLVKRPKAVYIEMVYDYGDFSVLGI